jgi:hypothetical protein
LKNDILSMPLLKPRPRYPSDEARKKQKPHVKVHLSIANHPKYGHVFEDPLLRGVIVGIWLIAARAHISATNDELTLSGADILWITGKERVVDGAKLLRRACEATAYNLRVACDRHPTCPRDTCERPPKWVVAVRNFSRKQGFTEITPQTPAETPHNSALSEEPKNQGTNNSVDAEFETAWSQYPKRAGGNSKKEALAAWRARIREGAKPSDLLAGLSRYTKFIRAMGKEGTEYVKQAARFFGPKDHWKELYEIPADHSQANGGFVG